MCNHFEKLDKNILVDYTRLNDGRAKELVYNAFTQIAVVNVYDKNYDITYTKSSIVVLQGTNKDVLELCKEYTCIK